MWSEFKSIAINGSVLDLALGFIIGAAFATLIQSFVKNIFMQLVAATFGQPDFSKVSINIGKTKVTYGAFLTDILNFMLLAIALFVIVKVMLLIGVERGRPLDQRPCPYCLTRVPTTALICASCSRQLVEELPSLADAERMLAERQARKWPTLPRRGGQDRSQDGGQDGTTQMTPETIGTAAGSASAVLDKN